MSKLKVFAEDLLKLAHRMKYVVDRAENNVGKGNKRAMMTLYRSTG